MTQILDKIHSKWGPRFPSPPNTSDTIRNIVYTLLDNQERYFIKSSEVGGDHLLIKTLGKDYRAKILNGIAKAGFNSNIWDIVKAQPISQPIGLVYHLDSTYDPTGLGVTPVNYQVDEMSADVPTVALKIESTAVSARPRATKLIIKKDSTQLSINCTFAEVFADTRQEALNDLLICASEVEIPEFDPVEIIKCSNLIHKRTMRGPANRIVCHPKYSDAFSVMKDRFVVFTDWQLPEDKILMWRSGASILDQPYILAPYVFAFHDSSDVGIRVITRHAKRLVNQNAIISVSIKS